MFDVSQVACIIAVIATFKNTKLAIAQVLLNEHVLISNVSSLSIKLPLQLYL